MNSYSGLVQAVINSTLNAHKEKRREQQYYNKRFQAPFCCGHRMKDESYQFWCSNCGKTKRKKGEV